MEKRYSKSRRDFLKTSFAGASSGIMVINALPGNLLAKYSSRAGVKDINPDIDNLRVVYCTDDSMVSQDPTSWSYTKQNESVDTDKVSEDMDRMAMALAEKSTASDAWATIFRKPDNKLWSEVKAAIKVNTQCADCLPRYAIMVKICNVFINQFQMSGSNICIYDSNYISHVGNQQGVNDTYEANNASFPFPSGVLFSANCFTGGKSTVSVTGGALSTVDCLSDLSDGTVDILVNIAVNKGHYQAGGVTLCQKNHIGSVKFFCPGKTEPVGQGSYTQGSGADIVALNQTDAIVGGDPVRQQLCIMDSIWAMKSGPIGSVTHAPHTIAMGTFGGAVDYLTTKKIREEDMSWTSDHPDDIDLHITGYGYSDTERENLTTLSPEQNEGRGWVDALTWNPTNVSLNKKQTIAQNQIVLRLIGNRSGVMAVQLQYPASKKLSGAKIFDLHGKTIKNFDLTSAGNVSALSWNGVDDRRKSLPSGTYLFCVEGKSFKKSMQFKFVR